MPIKTCKEDGKPGYKWGDTGKCYTYTPGDEASRKAAKKKAIKQAIAASYVTGKVDLSAEEIALLELNLQSDIVKGMSPLAVCSVCGHEEWSFIGGADPVSLPCQVCGGFMFDPAGFQYIPTTEDALKLHYAPWDKGTVKELAEPLAGIPDKCYCRECDYVLNNPKDHCKNLKCPECGATLYRTKGPD